MGKEIKENLHQYQVDGEIGRFSFTTHRLEVKGRQIYNSGVDLFPMLTAKEWYNTRGFKEIAYIYGVVEKSYRKTAELINRVRHQPKATPMRTLQEKIEGEGAKITAYLDKKISKILVSNEMKQDAKPKKAGKLLGLESQKLIAEDKVKKAIAECGQSEKIREEMSKNVISYEDQSKSVNISIDDVVVKEQKEERNKSEIKLVKGQNSSSARKYVHNTIAHIETQKAEYQFNAESTIAVLRMIVAFLINNYLLDKNIVFFTDGQKSLNAAIVQRLDFFRNIKLILDYYHLEKKCKELLSMALNGKIVRNEVLQVLTPLLWNGLVDQAVVYLTTLPPNCVRQVQYLEKLIEYLERNKPYIPSYCVRKVLGLRNSSNRGEKENDLIVSHRQKNNGMSWSKHGSVSLASLSSLKRNSEANFWFRTGDISFKLAA